jgi:hypothetical protein
MKRLATALAALVMTTSVGAQQSAAKRPVTSPKADAGMVVTGDQEAPLVLTIVPWQEPKPLAAPPPAGVLPALPLVLDHERGVAEEPLSRPLPAR